MFDIVWHGTGPSGVPIMARRDGFLIFDFEQSAAYAHVPVAEVDHASMQRYMKKNDDRYQYMNAFVMGLHSGLSVVLNIGTPAHPPVSAISWCRAFEDEGRWVITNNKHYEVEGANFLQSALPVGALDHAIEAMTKCEAVFGEDAVKILELCLIARNQFWVHQFASAHLIAWSITEKGLNKMWASLLHRLNTEHGGHTTISAKRREQLEGRDYTASVVTQMLSLHQQIDDDLLKRVDDARKARNNFAHSLRPITWENASIALITANDVLSKVVGTRIYCQAAAMWMT